MIQICKVDCSKIIISKVKIIPKTKPGNNTSSNSRCHKNILPDIRMTSTPSLPRLWKMFLLLRLGKKLHSLWSQPASSHQGFIGLKTVGLKLSPSHHLNNLTLSFFTILVLMLSLTTLLSFIFHTKNIILKNYALFNGIIKLL